MAEIMKMADMSLTPSEAQDMSSPMPVGDMPKYPWGLGISLCKDELDKLGFEAGDMEFGDIVHLHALAKVTSVSENETENGPNCRVELQIMFMEIESEDAENEEADAPIPAQKRRAMLYNRNG